MKEDESFSTTDELAKTVAEKLNAGTPRHEIIALLSEAGLDRSEAERFVSYIEGLLEEARKEASKQAGTKDIGCGLLLLIVGAAITLGTWAAAEAGGSYWIMWGAMVFGAFYILRGLYRKVTTTTESGIRLLWIVGGIILIGGMVGGGIAITNMMNPPEVMPPSDSFVVSEDNIFWEDEIQGIVRLSGTITNTHSKWSIKKVKVEVKAVDETNNIIKTYEVQVTPSTIPPGGTGIYSGRLQVPYSCVSVDTFLAWEWVPP